MVVAVVNPQAAEVLGKFYNKDPKALTFLDLAAVAGKNWADLAPGNTEVAKSGTPCCVWMRRDALGSYECAKK